MNMFDRQMSLIVAKLDMFERLLTPTRPVDLASFIHGRLALSRVVHEFLARNWDDLAENIDAHAAGDRRDRAELCRAFVSLRADYARHLVRWDGSSLVKDWSGYRADCQTLIRAMRALQAARSRAAMVA